MPFYVPVGPRSILFQFGMIWTDVMGSLSYWWTNHRRPVIPVPQSWPRAMPVGSPKVVSSSAARMLGGEN
jgi:hypothetical protein